MVGFQECVSLACSWWHGSPHWHRHMPGQRWTDVCRLREPGGTKLASMLDNLEFPESTSHPWFTTYSPSKCNKTSRRKHVHCNFFHLLSCFLKVHELLVWWRGCILLLQTSPEELLCPVSRMLMLSSEKLLFNLSFHWGINVNIAD